VNQPAWLAQAQQNALNMLLDETQGGHVIFEYEEDANHQPLYVKAISVCDTDKISTSLKRWRWSESGFGYMERSGVDPTPWSTLKLALTPEGSINADRILTGTLRSRQIINGDNSEFQVDTDGKCTAKAINITDGNIILTRENATLPTHEISVLGRVVQSLTDAGVRLLAGGVIDVQQGTNHTYIRGASESSIGGKLTVNGDLKVYGSNKDRVIRTEHYGDVPLSAYETAKPIFADEGHGKLDENGVCYIYLDDVFLETIDTTHTYKIFLTKYSQGDVWVKEVDKTYFIINGTPNLEFDWKVDCVQINHNQSYLNRIEYDTPEDMDYDSIADQYLTRYEREVLTDESNY
jgi:hypothetical protein